VRQTTGTITASRGWFARATGLALRGYEIHMGRTAEAGDPVATIADAAGGAPHADGALDASGWVAGCYVHGLFDAPPLRRALLESLAAHVGKSLPPATDEPDLDAELDRLAAHLAAHLDLTPVERALGLAPPF
jgi:adenosylcobyric acid synthase